MNEETEKQNKIISGVSTTIIAILLLLLFWFYTLSYDVPPIVKEAEVEVELIPPPPSGGGSTAVPVSSETQTTVPKMSMPSRSTEQTKDPNAVSEKKTSNTPNNSTNNSSDDFNPASKYSKSSSNNSNNSNQPDFGRGGSGGGLDDGDGKNKGSNKGDGGMIHSFGTRKIHGDNITHNCQIRGRIIFDVSVTPDGKITILQTDPGSTQNSCLENKARALMRTAKFDAVNKTGNSVGTITINFDLN